MMMGRKGRITSFPASLYLTMSWNSQECIELFTEPDVVLVVAARPDISTKESSLVVTPPAHLYLSNISLKLQGVGVWTKSLARAASSTVPIIVIIQSPLPSKEETHTRKNIRNINKLI